jgi:MIP family channel proteins
MRDAMRHFLAEFIGVFALVFAGGGAIMMAPAGPNGLLQIAVAHGLILGVMITATMRISGHLNPAVTIGFLAARRIEPMMAGVYVVAQLLGAMIAAYALRGLMPEVIFEAASAGGQSVSLDISGTQALLLEAIATFFLTFAVFGTAVDQKAPRIGGFAIGLVLTVMILTIGPLTGASLNPARTFGPAIVTGDFEGLAIYFAGPILGAVVAAVLYDSLFLRREPEPVDHGAVSR